MCVLDNASLCLIDRRTSPTPVYLSPDKKTQKLKTFVSQRTIIACFQIEITSNAAVVGSTNRSVDVGNVPIVIKNIHQSKQNLKSFFENQKKKNTSVIKTFLLT